MLAKELGIYDTANVGSAGTLVARKPGLRAMFLAELRRKLPFEATIAFCNGSDLIQPEMDNPFGPQPPPEPGTVYDSRSKRRYFGLERSVRDNDGRRSRAHNLD